MKLFFAFMVLSLGTSVNSIAQDDADVQWFETLFIIPKNKSLDEERRLADIKRMGAIETQDKRAEAKALIELGILHLTRIKDYEQALGWLIRSLTIEDSLSLHHEKIFTFLAMARVFEEVGDFNKSIGFLNEAKALDAKEENFNIRSLVLNESGRVNAAYGKVDEAYKNYQLVLEYSRNLELHSREADALFHLGQLSANRKKYNEALKTHKEALAIRRDLHDKSKEAISLNEIGVLYLLMNNYERSLANHVAALEIRQNLKDESALAESYLNIGALYIAKKDFKRAISNLDLALKAGQEAQDQEKNFKTYEYLSQCYKQLKDFKKALETKEASLVALDFIQGEKNERQLLETQNRYLMNKKEAEIDQLETTNALREKEIE